MQSADWVSLALICITGAMSPGPSLALVLGHTARGGRGAGVATGVGHGIGVGLYAGLAVAGLAVVLTAAPTVFFLLQLAGAAFLAWLAIGMLRSPAPDPLAPPPPASGRRAFGEGFLLAFFNPKIAAFFLALFSQYIDPASSASERVGMAVMAGAIDLCWYCLVAVVLSATGLAARIARHGQTLDRVMGVLLLGLAAWMGLRLFA